MEGSKANTLHCQFNTAGENWQTVLTKNARNGMLYAKAIKERKDAQGFLLNKTYMHNLSFGESWAELRVHGQGSIRFFD